MIWQNKVTQNKPANFFMTASFLLGIFGVTGPKSCPLILALPALCGRVTANYHVEACQEKCGLRCTMPESLRVCPEKIPGNRGARVGCRRTPCLSWVLAGRSPRVTRPGYL